MEFVAPLGPRSWPPIGTSCPDHFLRTKIWPLFLPFDPATEKADAVVSRPPRRLLEGYRERYEAYYERCRRPDLARPCATRTR